MAKKFARGAKPSPRHKLVSTPKHVKIKSQPTQFGIIPSQLSMWLNDVDPDCVTAEEAFAKAAYSIMFGTSELFIPDTVVGAWATKNGFLNGANLTDVMDAMIASGFPFNNLIYDDGSYTAVDWTNRDNLTSAIATGPVKIGVASSQFDNVTNVGVSNGWFMTGFTPDSNEDHCVSLCGYGPLSYLFGLFGQPVPSGVDGTAFGYLLFTWSTVGIIDEPSMLAVTAEAWLRNPTTPGFGPTPVPPSPPSPPSPPTPVPPTPVPPTPPAGLMTGTISVVNGQWASWNPGSISLKDELAQKGISLTVFSDLVQLFKDIQSKAGLATIMVDVEKLATDILGSGAKR